MSYKFDVEGITKACIEWIRKYFTHCGGENCNAVIGISGGKDSTVAAALCVEALGKDRVIGVLMPNGYQADLDDSYRVVDHLGIQSYTIDIGKATGNLMKSLMQCVEISENTIINLPPRIRMATLFAVAQSVNGRVVNTCNLSEHLIGYSTLFGDDAGHFAPLLDLTVSEVKQIGHHLGLPEDLIEKAPSDGLCGKTDEDNLGFSYEALDRYIRGGGCDEESKLKIDRLRKSNCFKRLMVELPFFLLPIRYIAEVEHEYQN